MDIKVAIDIIDEAPCFPGSAQQREAWQTLKSFVLAQLSHNKPSAQVCPHARLKWSVYDCTIKDSFALDLMDCNGEGTYSIPGNNGFGYSHQCNKVPGKPAHVG
ncbi:MAG: hypothetical protein PHS33_08850 [Candidatus Omnitrophica bacterium]|nr:hypothetical protein [Candidatus Omnitrophota bacterium]